MRRGARARRCVLWCAVPCYVNLQLHAVLCRSQPHHSPCVMCSGVLSIPDHSVETSQWIVRGIDMEARLSCPKGPPPDAAHMSGKLVDPEPVQNTQQIACSSRHPKRSTAGRTVDSWFPAIAPYLWFPAIAPADAHYCCKLASLSTWTPFQRPSAYPSQSHTHTHLSPPLFICKPSFVHTVTPPLLPQHLLLLQVGLSWLDRWAKNLSGKDQAPYLCHQVCGALLAAEQTGGQCDEGVAARGFV